MCHLSDIEWYSPPLVRVSFPVLQRTISVYNFTVSALVLELRSSLLSESSLIADTLSNLTT